MADLLRPRASAPRALRELLATHAPVIAPGAYDALSARLVEQAGFGAVYMTGFGTAASLLGRPDVGLIGLAEMVDNARRLVAAVDIPVIADADTGYGNAVNVIRTVQEYERAGVAALHLEDQATPKRCGHMSGKALIPTAEMVGKIGAALAARSDPDLVIIARSDARAVEGIDATVARARAYRDAGADMIFIDAMESVDDVERVARDVEGIGLLFPWVEGGRTPPVTMDQLASLGYTLVIRPVTTLLAATAAMRAALGGADAGMQFADFVSLIGLPEIDALGRASPGRSLRSMFEWSEEHEMVRQAMRQFVEKEIKPHLEELEHGDLPPYDILRSLYRTFGMDAMARSSFEKRLSGGGRESDGSGGGGGAAFMIIPIIEICHYCPGMVTAMGVSVGLTAAAIMSRGTEAQKRRWGLDLLTLDKIGAWAITEPGSGSDAFGSMRSTARRDGDDYILNGSKTFITNGPYADTIVFICKLDEGNEPRDRKVLSFVLDRGMEGFEQSKPLRKMGLHSSPTGELFLTDVRVGRDRLIGETEDVPARSGAKDTFSMERTGVAAMALGIVEQCLQLSVQYAKDRVQFGKPIGEFQLIQLKLAKMEVARMNIQNLVFRQIEMAAAGKPMGFAEASACKLYSAQTCMEVALEAVQLFGGNGYMAEFQVEQLCRDAKVLQIYAGTDEIQISQIARSLLATS